MAHKYRYRIDKKEGLNKYLIRYGWGCQCAWNKLEVRVPEGMKPDDVVRKIVHFIEDTVTIPPDTVTDSNPNNDLTKNI